MTNNDRENSGVLVVCGVLQDDQNSTPHTNRLGPPTTRVLTLKTGNLTQSNAT